MKKPQIWRLEENQQNYRVAFNFTDQSGKSLKTRALQFQTTRGEPTKLIVLQASAKPVTATQKPAMRVLAPNFIEVTTVVSAIEGELISMAFVQYRGAKIDFTAYAITFLLMVENGGIHFSIYVRE